MNLNIIAKALALTVIDQIGQVGGVFARPLASKYVKIGSGANAPPNPWAVRSLVTKKAIDGAILEGVVPQDAWAKYALPKGLPEEGQKTLVIENEAHEINDFNGVIKEGYGKGTKKLLVSQRVPVKIEGRTPFLGKINYHVHDADKAGLHYDLVVEGVPSGTKQFEINIPNGPFKARYAFLTTDKGMLAIRMKDRGMTLIKPSYKLRPEELLTKLTNLNRQAVKGQEPYSIEWKPDGSLGNASIEDYRVVFKSHRAEADTYYDKLPGLEFLKPKNSNYALWNVVNPPVGPDLTGTVLQGELFHKNGVSFVSGVLNSLPERAQIAQLKEGTLEYYIWDIRQFKGKDVTNLPYGQRRILAEQVVSEIRKFNPNYHIVEKLSPRGDALKFYEKTVEDPRGLPWSEGVVIKDNLKADGFWEKVKSHDLTDVVITGFVEGNGEDVGNLGAIIVASMDGTKTGKVGTGYNDLQKRWMWENQDKLYGSVIKTKILEETDTSFRAPRFEAFHESKGTSDFGLQMYSYELAMGDDKDAKRILYSLKSARGWRPK